MAPLSVTSEPKSNSPPGARISDNRLASDPRLTPLEARKACGWNRIANPMASPVVPDTASNMRVSG